MRRMLALVLVALLISPPCLGSGLQGQLPSGQPEFKNIVRSALRQLTDKSYTELMEQAAALNVTAGEAELVRLIFEGELKEQQAAVDKEKEANKQQIGRLKGELKKINDAGSSDTPERAEQRRKIHCALLAAQVQAVVLEWQREDLVIAYENRVAKLNLLVKWPADSERIKQRIANNTARQRRHGVPEDIGHRDGFKGQHKDISWGNKILGEMSRYNAIPPEVDVDAQKRYDRVLAAYVRTKKALETAARAVEQDPERFGAVREANDKAAAELQKAQLELALAVDLTEYVRETGLRIARASDATIPIRWHLIWDDDPNAFALPGGHIFINTGLIYGKLKPSAIRELTGADPLGEKLAREVGARAEAELAGVMAHEVAHDTARHARKLMKQANIWSTIMMGAIIALTLFFPPASYGAYYLYQLLQVGMGFLLNLRLLGVSREYEAEADQLGVQYSWSAGYDPHGFVHFNEYMAGLYGHVQGSSWFRTHPPSYDRIHDSFAELSYLPAKENLQVDSEGFRKAVETLKILREARMERLRRVEKNAPTMGEPRPECPENAAWCGELQ